MADCFVGRQPIFDGKNILAAYELLYREGFANNIGGVNRTVATSRVIINAFVEIGIENIVGARRAMINVDETFLLDSDLLCFPPDQVVLELPEELGATPGVTAALDRLDAADYSIAINGYRHDAPVAELLRYADMVKLDALDIDDGQLAAEIATLGNPRPALIAKRVESYERRDELAALGFSYFQGRYIARPEVITGKRLPTNRTAILQLVARMSDPDLESAELEELIARDAALSLRILRFVNSPMSGLTHEVDSIHHAVVLTGRATIKKWVMLLALASLDNSIPELITRAFVRAKLCEQLADEADLDGRESFFTVGLFSLMDTMMARPMEELLETLPFTDEVKAALIERTGARGQAVVCAQNLEDGRPETSQFADLPISRISELYLDSLSWADEAVLGTR